MTFSKHDDYDDPNYFGYCEECGEFVETALVDNGIGPYEFWGAKGYHHDWRLECPLCGGIVDEGQEREDEDA